MESCTRAVPITLGMAWAEESTTEALYSYTVNVRTVSKKCAGAFRRALAPPGKRPAVGRCRVRGKFNQNITPQRKVNSEWKEKSRFSIHD
jgi:hypothetical protein